MPGPQQGQGAAHIRHLLATSGTGSRSLLIRLLSSAIMLLMQVLARVTVSDVFTAWALIASLALTAFLATRLESRTIAIVSSKARLVLTWTNAPPPAFATDCRASASFDGTAEADDVHDGWGRACINPTCGSYRITAASLLSIRNQVDDLLAESGRLLEHCFRLRHCGSERGPSHGLGFAQGRNESGVVRVIGAKVSTAAQDCALPERVLLPRWPNTIREASTSGGIESMNVRAACRAKSSLLCPSSRPAIDPDPSISTTARRNDDPPWGLSRFPSIRAPLSSASPKQTAGSSLVN